METRQFSMDIKEIADIARAIIYASAIGIIIHIAGTELHNSKSDTELFGRGFEAFAIAMAILFVIMNGISLYFLRNEEFDPKFAPHLSALLFVLEIMALFSLCYWIAASIALGSCMDPRVRLFLAIFGLTNFVHNFLSFMLFVMKKEKQLASLKHLYGFPQAIWSYGANLLVRDVFEQKVSGTNEYIAKDLSLLANSYARLQEKMGQGSGDDFEKGAADCANIRIRAQLIIIHIFMLHLVIGVILLPGVWERFSSWRLGHLRFAAPSELSIIIGVFIISVILWFLAKNMYVFTSSFEYQRKQRGGKKPGRREKASQVTGNVCLLSMLLICIWYLPLWALYVIYFLSMTLVIRAVLIANDDSSNRSAPQPSSPEPAAGWVEVK